MTPEIVLSMGRIYVDHFNALQHDVLDMLSGNTKPEWSRDELVEIQQSLTANAPRLLPAVDQLLSYVHHRTLQRLTLEAARQSHTDSQTSRFQRRSAFAAGNTRPLVLGDAAIISSIVRREYGQSLPWCG